MNKKEPVENKSIKRKDEEQWWWHYWICICYIYIVIVKGCKIKNIFVCDWNQMVNGWINTKRKEKYGKRHWHERAAVAKNEVKVIETKASFECVLLYEKHLLRYIACSNSQW
jgi:hypothetical protein